MFEIGQGLRIKFNSFDRNFQCADDPSYGVCRPKYVNGIPLDRNSSAHCRATMSDRPVFVFQNRTSNG